MLKLLPHASRSLKLRWASLITNRTECPQWILQPSLTLAKSYPSETSMHSLTFLSILNPKRLQSWLRIKNLLWTWTMISWTTKVWTRRTTNCKLCMTDQSKNRLKTQSPVSQSYSQTLICNWHLFRARIRAKRKSCSTFNSLTWPSRSIIMGCSK